MAGGLPGALAGDNLGALATRKGINRAYASRRARKRLGAGASKQAVRQRAAKINKALTRKEHRQGVVLGDQIGWGVGNAVAQATPGVPIPLRGGFVAMRSVPQIVRNVQRMRKGQLKPRDFLRQTGKDIYHDNNLKRAVRRGNARERLMRRRINKQIKRSGFRRRLRVITFHRDPMVAFSQAYRPTVLSLPHTETRQAVKRRSVSQYTKRQNQGQFYSAQDLTFRS